jgi:hypothetical protein
MSTEDEPKAKELLSGEAKLDEVVDAATRKELERWFGLPSIDAQEAAGLPTPPADRDLEEAKKRRAWAIEAVDATFLAQINDRVADRSDQLFQFKPNLEVAVDPDIAAFDHAMLARVGAVADPREVERPEDIADEMKSVAPQALLRDLHRPVTDFTKQMERVDVAAEQKLDIVAEVRSAMKTSWKLPPLSKLPFVEAREYVEQAIADRNRSWPEQIRSLKLVNRRVEQDP